MATQLSTARVRRLLHCVEELYACPGLEEFPAQVLRSVPRVVRSRCTSYTEIDPRSGRVVALADPDEWDLTTFAPLLMRHRHEHPLIRHTEQTGTGSALRISDFLSVADYHRTGLYNELYGTAGMGLGDHDQMAVVLPTRSPVYVGVVVNRTRRDFSEGDRAVMNLLRPHLLQAYRTAARASLLGREADLLRDTLDGADVAVVRLDRAGKPAHASASAVAWLAHFFPGDGGRGRLPAAVADWARRQGGVGSPDALPGVRAPLVVEREDGERLEIRRLGHRPGGHTLLFLERHAPPPSSPRPLERLGLTPREAEVLFWVAQGKTNPEVAIILSISKRTVQKHVEHVFGKLGVETRTAAALLAAEVLRSPGRA